jgi:hypothetical protein
MKSNEDIMNGAPERLPLLREVNHRIPIVNKNKRYKYHSPRCPVIGFWHRISSESTCAHS